MEAVEGKGIIGRWDIIMGVGVVLVNDLGSFESLQKGSPVGVLDRLDHSSLVSHHIDDIAFGVCQVLCDDGLQDWSELVLCRQLQGRQRLNDGTHGRRRNGRWSGNDGLVRSVWRRWCAAIGMMGIIVHDQ